MKKAIDSRTGEGIRFYLDKAAVAALKKKSKVWGLSSSSIVSMLIRILCELELNEKGAVVKNLLANAFEKSNGGKEVREELESIYEVFLRLIEENRLPSWLEVDTGIIRSGGKNKPYVKSWRIK